MKNWLEPIRDSHNLLYTIILFVLCWGVLLYIYPKGGSFSYEYSEGEFWQHDDLKAEFDFDVYRTDEELLQMARSLQNDALPIYKATPEIEEQSYLKFDSVFTKLISTGASYDSVLAKTVKETTLDQLELGFKKGLIDLRAEDLNPDLRQVGMISGGIIKKRAYSDLETPASFLEVLKKLSNADESFDLARNIALEEAIKGNYTFDKASSDLLIQAELSTLKQKVNSVKKGDLLLSKGQLITLTDVRNLRALDSSYDKRIGASSNSLMITIGQAILIALCLFAVVIVLLLFHPATLREPKRVSLILLLILTMVVMVKLSIGISLIHHYLVPLCVLPIIIRTFYDVKMALLLHIVTVFMISFVVPDPFEFVFLQIFAGILLQFGMNNLHRRSQFFASAIVIFLSYTFTYLGINIVQEGSVSNFHWSMLGWFGGNAALSLLAYPFIYAVERGFGLVSDLRLIEISDTNNKLLRELNEKAPGTFQHTLQVANLAEEAVRAVGGSILLVRAGALYHDIGKMNNPQFFIENQHGQNPHDDISPIESAEIIIDHVLDGISMAKKNGLPEELIDFIRTHHGTSRVEYFYRKELEVNPEVDPMLFTYPGPKPFSKETAVLMMADGVEAASRSLGDYSEESIGKLIDGMIAHHLSAGQFDQAEITLKEIDTIKGIFKKKLMNIYHARIAYPSKNK